MIVYEKPIDTRCCGYWIETSYIWVVFDMTHKSYR